jgi:hypothetical protein
MNRPIGETLPTCSTGAFFDVPDAYRFDLQPEHCRQQPDNDSKAPAVGCANRGL